MVIKGKNVLVTGSSKGIGRACAEAFAAEGANVVINYVHDEAAAQEVADVVRSQGVKALVVKADITIQSEVDAMFEKISQEFKTLDILVSNTGGVYGNDGSENLAGIQKIFELNLFSAIRVTNATRKLMNNGKIIFTSSIHGKLGHGRPNVIGYSSAKAALESYVKNLAKEVAPNILVNAVAPGRTLTPAWGEMSEEQKVEQATGHLINRWIEPSEIADGVIFLAKNDAVCGEVLVIDGGMSLKTIG